MTEERDTTQRTRTSPNTPALGREEAEAILGRLASVFQQNIAPSDAKVVTSELGLPSRESMYRILVEQIPAVVFIAYLDGGISEAYVSPQIEKTLGFSQEEWLEDPIRWYRQIHPEDKDRWSLDAAHLFLTGERFRSAYRVMARDGKVVWFDCEIRMIRRRDGTPWFMHGVGFDISELKRTEEALQVRSLALRDLSSRLLRVQDQERRRIARELHDGLGQYLVALKMNLDLLRQREGNNLQIAEAQEILEHCLTETRTLSHLLHPPMLDEVGFFSAARWYVDGFAKRSGILVTSDIPERNERLPSDVEVVLFRVLQEALTNIHRHSQSPSAEIQVILDDVKVALQIRDCGRGIPSELLENFRNSGAQTGVGLSGMRERVNECGGRLDIHSENRNTTVLVTIPLTHACGGVGNPTS
jgi:PAS domain S-box-containing protein